MDTKLKEDIVKIFWPLVNTVMIVMLFLLFLFTKANDTTAIEKTGQLEQRVDNQEKMINFLISTEKNNCKPDTIIINVNTTTKK